ncbi:chorismate-binding protein [Ornithinimicrobium sp. Y1847]|uniref:chorismate-binding protein n=1 Tax=Ornithinimicrobium sp. Y1847 TaxID=3405419 RepID=UPI003B6845A1
MYCLSSRARCPAQGIARSGHSATVGRDVDRELVKRLDGLEGAARGIYSGAIGWIGLDGSMDTSIVIRTATWVQGAGAGGDVAFGVGGAVTALSSPEEEYAEMVTKAQSVLRALARAH